MERITMICDMRELNYLELTNIIGFLKMNLGWKGHVNVYTPDEKSPEIKFIEFRSTIEQYEFIRSKLRKLYGARLLYMKATKIRV